MKRFGQYWLLFFVVVWTFARPLYRNECRLTCIALENAIPTKAWFQVLFLPHNTNDPEQVTQAHPVSMPYASERLLWLLTVLSIVGPVIGTRSLHYSYSSRESLGIQRAWKKVFLQWMEIFITSQSILPRVYFYF